MAECGAVCEHLHLPLQSGSDRTLARMHRGYTAERYLRRLADARAAIPDLAVTTDLIVGFPGETDADFVRTLEVVDAAEYDAAYTFVFSPRPGTPAADMTDDFVAPEVAQERMSRLVEVVERHALAKHEARVGRTETLLVEGPSKKDPHVWSGRTRQNKLVHFSPGAHERRGRRRGRRPHHPRRAALVARRPARHGARPPSGPHPHPRHRRACVTAPHLAIVGPTASGKSALALEVARAFGDVEIVSIDSMQVYRGLDIGTAKPTRGRARRGPAPPRRRGRARRRVVGGAVPARSTRRDRRHRASRAAARCSSAAPVCTCRRWSTRSPSRREDRDGARRAARPYRDARGPRRRLRRAAARRPRRRGTHRARQRPAGGAGARGDPDHRATVLVVRCRPPGVRAPRCSRSASPACGSHGPVLNDRIERRFAPMRGAGLVDEVRGLEARGALSRTARQAIGYREVLAHLDGEIPVARRRVRGRGRPHPAVRPSPTHVVPARPPDPVVRGARESVLDPPRAPGKLERMRTIRLSKLHATGNDFLVWSWLRHARRGRRDRRRAGRCAL